MHADIDLDALIETLKGQRNAYADAFAELSGRYAAAAAHVARLDEENKALLARIVELENPPTGDDPAPVED